MQIASLSLYSIWINTYLYVLCLLRVCYRKKKTSNKRPSWKGRGKILMVPLFFTTKMPIKISYRNKHFVLLFFYRHHIGWCVSKEFREYAERQFAVLRKIYVVSSWSCMLNYHWFIHRSPLNFSQMLLRALLTFWVAMKLLMPIN